MNPLKTGDITRMRKVCTGGADLTLTLISGQSLQVLNEIH